MALDLRVQSGQRRLRMSLEERETSGLLELVPLLPGHFLGSCDQPAIPCSHSNIMLVKEGSTECQGLSCPINVQAFLFKVLPDDRPRVEWSAR